MQDREEGAPPERRPINLSVMLAFALLALTACVAVVAAQIWQWRQETRGDLLALRASILTEEGFRSIAGSLPVAGAAARDASLPRAVVDLIKLELPPLLGAAAAPMPILVEPVEDLVLRRTVPFVRIGSEGGAEIRRIISELHAELQTMTGSRSCAVAVEGHTDTKGSDAANLELSEKRARFVAEALAGEFSTGTVSVAGWGERRLKVLTPDATDEIENRRVEITLTCPPSSQSASLMSPR
jgi:hypothetical protein